jgi:hypothetical protein
VTACLFVFSSAIIECETRKPKSLYLSSAVHFGHHHVSRSFIAPDCGRSVAAWHHEELYKMRRKAAGCTDIPTICDTALEEQDIEGNGPCSSRRLQQDDQRAEHLTAAKDGKRRILQRRRGATISRFALASRLIFLFPVLFCRAIVSHINSTMATISNST